MGPGARVLVAPFQEGCVGHGNGFGSGDKGTLRTQAGPPAVSQAGCAGERHWRGQACRHREVSADSWVPRHPTWALVQEAGP